MNLRELGRDILETFRPPSGESVSEWADHYRIIVGKSAPEPGPWHTDRAPYQREIMDSFSQRGVHDIVVMSAAQVGKTDMMLNMIGRMIHLNPGPSLLVMPRDEDVENFSKERLSPTIQETPVLASLVYGGMADTITQKNFKGGFLSMTGAMSPGGLKSRPIAFLFMDEVDGYPPSAGVEGDPVSLARKRTQNFAFARRVMTSTPTIKGTSRIYREFMRGTQEEWEITCPHCGEHSEVVFDDIRFDKRVISVTDNVEEYEVTQVHWRCPKCGALAEEYEAKRAPGLWVPRNPAALKHGIRSFHINAFLSPWTRWADICKKFLDGKDDAETLKTFWNLELGLPFEYKSATAIPEMLYMRREHYEHEVPEGVLVITIGMDTQGNRLQYEVKGWGRNEESWGLEYGALPGRADEPEVWELVDMLLDREWTLCNGRKMRAAVTFIDAGGNYWDDVMEQCYKRRHKRIYPIQGENRDQDGPLVRHTSSTRTGRNWFRINVYAGKRAILNNAGIQQPGPRYMHFPDDPERGYDETYFKGLISEQVRLVKKRGVYVEEWVKIYTRNEPLDVSNYARCAFRGFRIDLDSFERRFYGEKKIQPADTSGRPKRPRGLISGGIKV